MNNNNKINNNNLCNSYFEFFNNFNCVYSCISTFYDDKTEHNNDNYYFFEFFNNSNNNLTLVFEFLMIIRSIITIKSIIITFEIVLL